MQFPADLRYTKEHEWLRLQGGEAVVGITDFAQDALGVVESNKTVSDLFAPVGGTVLAVNQSLRDEPEAVNRDPYGAGWMVKLAPANAGDANGLLDAAAYQAFVAAEKAK